MSTKLRPQPIPDKLPTYSTTLSTGREVTMRQAIAQDLVVLQGAYGDRSEVEQGIYMMARLAAGKEPIRLSEIQTLSVPDFRLLSDLVAKCTGMDLDEEEELDEGK